MEIVNDKTDREREASLYAAPKDERLSDFHTHSTCSDGSATPFELVARASRNGVRYLSLTDHDSMDGVREAADAAAAAGVIFVPGVELSASFNCEIHILGYFSRQTFHRFFPFLDDIKRERRERNASILVKLAALGVNISEDDIARAAAGGGRGGSGSGSEGGGSGGGGGGSEGGGGGGDEGGRKKRRAFGRPHIATALINAGAARDMEHAFKQYLGRGGAAYVKRRTPNPIECVRAITAAGGVASLAHPVHIDMKLGELRAFARGLRAAGLQGIEAYYPDNTPAETDNFVGLANELGLIATGGSDYHGVFRPGVEPGTGRFGNLRAPEESALRLIALTER